MNERQSPQCERMPAELFERIIGVKSEQNSSGGVAPDENIPIQLNYGEPTSEHNSATSAAAPQSSTHVFVKGWAGRSQIKGALVSCFAQTRRGRAATIPSKHRQRSELIAGRKPSSEIRDADAF